MPATCPFVVGLGKGKSTVAYSHHDLYEVCVGSMTPHINWWLPSPDNRNNFRSRQNYIFPLPLTFQACWECPSVHNECYASKYTVSRTAQK